MSNVNSAKYAATVRSGLGAELITDSYTFATSHAQGDTLTMVKLPKGFVVTGISFYCDSKPGATSGVYSIGDGTTAARWAATSTISAATKAFYSVADFTALTADTNLVLTLTTLTGAAAAHSILITVHGTFNP